MSGHPQGISFLGFDDQGGDPVPLREVHSGGKVGDRGSPDIPKGRTRGDQVRERDQVLIRVGGATEADNEALRVPFKHPFDTGGGDQGVGDMKELAQVRELGDDEDINRKDPIGMGEGFEADREETGPSGQ